MVEALPERDVRWRPYTWISMLAGLAAGGGGLWIVSRNVSAREVIDAASSANFSLLAAALALVIFASWLRAVRWRGLFAEDPSRLTVVGLWRIILIGQFINVVLPVRAGEISRPYLVRRRFGRDWWETGGTIALEKAFDGVAFALLLLMASMVLPLPEAIEGLRFAIVIPAAGAAGALVAFALGGASIVRHLERFGARGGWRARVFGGLAAFTRTFGALRRPSVAGRLLMQSLAIWAIASIPNYLVMAALDMPIAPVSGLAILIALQLGTAIASTPGNIGLFEVICVGILAAFGIERAPALAYGVLLHVTAYSFPLVVGGVLTGVAIRDGLDPWRGATDGKAGG